MSKPEVQKLLSVCIIGKPNAGKSTLLSVLTAAKPEIADYPFTTLVPNLGIVRYRDIGSFVMADIPGIIEGAHTGKGLGIRFLRHIERNAVLLFMLPATSEDIAHEYEILRNELQQYNPELMEIPHLIAVTKCDLVATKDVKKICKKLPSTVSCIPISSVTQKGLAELQDALWEILQREA